MTHPERYVVRLRRRLLIGEVLHVAAGWLAGFFVTFGVAVLCVKLFEPRFWPDVLWFGLLAVPLFGVVAWRAVRRSPSDRDAVALLDERVGAGGLLMTLTERPDPLWQDRLPAASAWSDALPRVRPTRFAKAVAVPALFAVGAGFVPAREEPPPKPQVTAGTEAAQELAETFELLERSDALDDAAKESLKQELEQLAEQAELKPLTHETWETVDALRAKMRSGLETTELSVSNGRAAAAALAAVFADGDALSIERAAQLDENLRQALETLRRNGAFDGSASGSVPRLPAELQRLLKDGGFSLPTDAAARREALDGLERLLDEEQKRLAEARAECEQCLGGPMRPGDALDRLPVRVAGQVPGRGGAARGRGDAELTYGDETDEQAVKFKETVLPPGFLDEPNESLAGVTASAPEVDPSGAEARNAARDSGRATGRTTWDRPLRPRHRDVVRGYFGDE